MGRSYAARRGLRALGSMPPKAARPPIRTGSAGTFGVPPSRAPFSFPAKDRTTGLTNALLETTAYLSARENQRLGRVFNEPV